MSFLTNWVAPLGEAALRGEMIGLVIYAPIVLAFFIGVALAVGTEAIADGMKDSAYSDAMRQSGTVSYLMQAGRSPLSGDRPS